MLIVQCSKVEVMIGAKPTIQNISGNVSNNGAKPNKVPAIMVATPFLSYLSVPSEFGFRISTENDAQYFERQSPEIISHGSQIEGSSFSVMNISKK